jgi:hypothetical protein
VRRWAILRRSETLVAAAIRFASLGRLGAEMLNKSVNERRR